LTPLTPNPSRFLAFDLLATLVAVVRSDGVALFANAALEDAMGQSRRSIEGSHFPDSFAQPQVLSSALTSANDNEFAQAWVENRSTFRPRSRRALAMELRQKGLDDETVSSVISEVDEDALAYDAAQKRVGRLKGLEWNDFRKKLSEFLARRGFPYSVISPVVTRTWGETHTEGEQIKFEDEDIS